MGKRGPKPTPTATLKRRGSWRANEREGEPQPETLDLTPRCPSHLSAAEKKIWRRTAKQLVSMRVLTQTDLDALTRYCVLSAMFDADRKWLLDNADGLVWIGKEPYQSKRILKLNDAVSRLGAEFGLTPSSRTKLRIEPTKSESDNGEKAKTNYFRVG